MDVKNLGKIRRRRKMARPRTERTRRDRRTGIGCDHDHSRLAGSEILPDE